MSLRDTFVRSISISQLKGLRNVEVSFREQGLTGILGLNGSGKTSILHVLACLYHPYSSDFRSYKYSDFFLPTYYPDSSETENWIGTSFSVNIRDRGNDKTRSISKGAKRWSFQAKSYNLRNKHFVSYIGLKSAFPEIEQERITTQINFNQVSPLETEDDQKILRYASIILGKDYNSYETCVRFDKKSHIGVRARGSRRYCSLSMGAGEQRVFYILREVFRLIRKPSSLILIDELDILLHQDSVIKLVKTLNEIISQSENRMQIIFTTHNHNVLSESYVDFRHIFHTRSGRTLCFHNTNPYMLKSLTGVVSNKIAIYVEDILSESIVKQVCSELEVKEFCEVHKCGTIQNVIAAAVGIFYSERSGAFSQSLFVLDGDKYTDSESRFAYLRKLLNGSVSDNEDAHRLIEGSLVNLVVNLDCSEGPGRIKPDQYYANVIAEIPKDQVPPEYNELYLAIVNGVSTPKFDSHDYLKCPARQIYDDDKQGYFCVVKLLAKATLWKEITAEVRSRIQEIKDQMCLNPLEI